MKEYDRQSKSWDTPEEKERKLKKRKSCKGGREHDWVEILPPYGVEATSHYKGNTQPYYDAENAIADFTERTYKKLAEEHGIVVRRTPWRPQIREYMCSICHKKSYGKKI